MTLENKSYAYTNTYYVYILLVNKILIFKRKYSFQNYKDIYFKKMFSLHLLVYTVNINVDYNVSVVKYHKVVRL